MTDGITRRRLLKAAGITVMGGVGASGYKSLLHALTPESGVPQRTLGKTGARVSLLAFGCGGRFIKGFPSDEEALKALNTALANGINYFDTAYNYGKGESERRLGLFLREHRREVFISTKLEPRDEKNFMAQFEASLLRLQTDHVDLLHIHGLSNMGEVEQMGKKGGVYRCLTKLKEERAVRFTGFSCHDDGQVAKAAIENYDFDCCTIQINAAKAGGFEGLALPAALKKKMGVSAIKVTGGGGKLLGKVPGKATMGELLDYVWNLPVSSIIVGMPNLKMMEQNIRSAQNFKGMSRSEAERLRLNMAHFRPDLERFFRRHTDRETA